MTAWAAVGCSYTAGWELADADQAWPCVVARRRGHALVNFARPAAANDHIVDTVAREAGYYPVWLIGWSGYDRVSFSDDQGEFSVWPGRPRPDSGPRRTLATWFTAEADLTWLYQRYVTQVLAVQALLQAAGADWVMLDAFLNDEAAERLSPRVQPLLQQIDRTKWVPGNMRRFTDHLPKGAGGHTLTAGHELTAERVLAHAPHIGH